MAFSKASNKLPEEILIAPRYPAVACVSDYHCSICQYPLRLAESNKKLLRAQPALSVICDVCVSSILCGLNRKPD